MSAARRTAPVRGARAPPRPHPCGARPPAAARRARCRGTSRIVMDGNGRWAQGARAAADRGPQARRGRAVRRGRGRDRDRRRSGCRAYAFSTENWKRSPDEVRFLMGFNRDVIRRRRDEMHELGVRVRWAGRRPRLWRSVINELEVAEELTRDNDVLTLTMCVNYGGRAEIADAARGDRRATSPPAGSTRTRSTRRRSRRYLDEPDMPDVDLFVRTVRRAAHLELPALAVGVRRDGVPVDTLWPDFDRRHLWKPREDYAQRDRRYGGRGAPGDDTDDADDAEDADDTAEPGSTVSPRGSRSRRRRARPCASPR